MIGRFDFNIDEIIDHPAQHAKYNRELLNRQMDPPRQSSSFLILGKNFI